MFFFRVQYFSHLIGEWRNYPDLPRYDDILDAERQAAALQREWYPTFRKLMFRAFEVG